MYFNLFLWPMLLPLIIPISYCIIYRKDRLGEILVISLSMILIVILYWPLSFKLYTDANFYAKVILFVILPILLLYIYRRIHKHTLTSDEKIFEWKHFGITNEGLEKSLKLGLFFIPIMIGATFVINFYLGVSANLNFYIGACPRIIPRIIS